MKSLHYKFFLEGVEIPLMGFDAHFTYKSHFNVDIPPVDEANEIQPGTYGVIAFKEGATNDWHLLCEGFFVGLQYSKRGSHRSLSLQFRDVQFFLENNLLVDAIGDDRLTVSPFLYMEKIFKGDASEPAQKFIRRVEIHGDLVSSKSENPLERAFEKMMGFLKSSNEFIKKHSEAWKLNLNRLTFIENANLSKFAWSNTMLAESLSRLLGDFDNSLELLWIIASFVKYDIMPIPCMGNDLASFVTKPNLELGVPPACNVIFPDDCVNFSFSVNYSSKVSRLHLTAESLKGTTQQFFVAPKEIKVKSGRVEVIVTDEEKLRGIIPSVRRIPYTETILSKVDPEFTSELVDYLYFEEKFRTVPMNLNGVFNPGILPGFPLLSLDRVMPMIGYVTSVTHSYDSSSPAAVTSVTLTHVRSAKREMPLLSKWYDSKTFAPDKIGASLYSLLGTDVFSEVEIGQETYNATKAVENLQKDFHEYQTDPDNLKNFKDKFKRKLPVLFNEETGEGDIVNSLGMKYNEGDGLTSIEGMTSPINVDLAISSGIGVSALRRAGAERLRETLNDGIWSRIKEESDEV